MAPARLRPGPAWGRAARDSAAAHPLGTRTSPPLTCLPCPGRLGSGHLGPTGLGSGCPSGSRLGPAGVRRGSELCPALAERPRICVCAGAGMVVDWEQETGLLVSSGDVRIVRIWDTDREMKVQVTRLPGGPGRGLCAHSPRPPAGAPPEQVVCRVGGAALPGRLPAFKGAPPSVGEQSALPRLEGLPLRAVRSQVPLRPPPFSTGHSCGRKDGRLVCGRQDSSWTHPRPNRGLEGSPRGFLLLRRPVSLFRAEGRWGNLLHTAVLQPWGA